jgi:hypothetical protein
LVHPQPVFTVNYSDSICLNDTAVLIANSSDLNTNFIWKYNGIANASPNLFIIGEQIGQIECKLISTTQNSCSDSAVYTVNTLGLPEFNLGNDTSFCNNEDFILTLKTGLPQNKHLWNTNQEIDSITVFQSGLYFAEVKSSFGCKFSDSILIEELTAPVFDLGSDRFVNPNLSVNEMISAGNNFAKYSWNTGDTNYFINVTDTGLYSVVVENLDGCKENDSLYIQFWDIATKINKVEIEKNKIKIYPNPSNNYITIASEKMPIGQIRIYSNVGQIIYQNNINSKQFTIDNIGWASGLYIVETTQNGLVQRNRINIIR